VASFADAGRIVAWHLTEARRFFGDLALPVDLSNSARLDAWLLDYCTSKGLAGVPTRTIQQYGPGDIRERVAIEAAVRELDNLGRARSFSRAGIRKCA